MNGADDLDDLVGPCAQALDSTRGFLLMSGNAAHARIRLLLDGRTLGRRLAGELRAVRCPLAVVGDTLRWRGHFLAGRGNGAGLDGDAVRAVCDLQRVFFQRMGAVAALTGIGGT